MRSVSLLALASLTAASLPAAFGQTVPETVGFMSADGKTQLLGYIYAPTRAAGPVPAIVMMHGRAGAYSALAKGVYDGSTLSKRHKFWGETLANEGYLAILVDGFGPRGYPQGFPAHSYDQRPAELDEVNIRPLDAYGALAYLRTRPDVQVNSIALLGWSNGGSAALSTMSADTPGLANPSAETGFRGALVFYPACGLKGQFDNGYRSYAPVRIFIGTADGEVSAKRCEALVDMSASLGSDIRIYVYSGATHGFDDPSRKRSEVPANADATDDAVPRALRFLSAHFKRSADLTHGKE